MNDKDDVQFSVTSLDQLEDSQLDAIADQVLASEEGATALRSIVRTALATALRSGVTPAGPTED